MCEVCWISRVSAKSVVCIPLVSLLSALSDLLVPNEWFPVCISRECTIFMYNDAKATKNKKARAISIYDHQSSRHWSSSSTRPCKSEQKENQFLARLYVNSTRTPRFSTIPDNYDRSTYTFNKRDWLWSSKLFMIHHKLALTRRKFECDVNLGIAVKKIIDDIKISQKYRQQLSIHWSCINIIKFLELHLH